MKKPNPQCDSISDCKDQSDEMHCGKMSMGKEPLLAKRSISKQTGEVLPISEVEGVCFLNCNSQNPTGNMATGHPYNRANPGKQGTCLCSLYSSQLD